MDKKTIEKLIDKLLQARVTPDEDEKIELIDEVIKCLEQCI